jgi:hypothetical protein
MLPEISSTKIPVTGVTQTIKSQMENTILAIEKNQGSKRGSEKREQN